MRHLTRSSIASIAVAATVLAGCGGGDPEPIEPGGPAPADDATDAPDDEATDDEATDGDAPDDIAPADDAGLDESNPPVEEELDVEYDEAAAIARAEELLGAAEEDLPTDDPDVRVLRRGDEDLMGTMDLRPGRANLELDDDGSGAFVVSRIEVETPDGEPIVVE